MKKQIHYILKSVSLITTILFVSTSQVFAAPEKTAAEQFVLADTELLKSVGIPIIVENQKIKVGIARINKSQELLLSVKNHSLGRCGGFESLGNAGLINIKTQQFNMSQLSAELNKLENTVTRFNSVKLSAQKLTIEADPNIQAAVNTVDQTEVEKWIRYLAAFGGRYHAASDPNIHVRDLKSKLQLMLAESGINFSIRTVAHTSTDQQSLVVTLHGKSRPKEIIVLGGHLDSINQTLFDNKNNAPGADDNASGSGSLLEALRVIVKNGQPERTIEFMWYAAEEVGLFGSKEIATEYKNAGKEVIAVMQLDMTLQPGEGEMIVNSISDFTHPWLRQLFKELNSKYIGVQVIETACGYACSDHASWFRQGFPTFFPTESSLNKMNRNIHSRNDVVSPASSFRHATHFSKIAVSFAMYMGNSDIRVP
jgi:leucyl aminopeptidase